MRPKGSFGGPCAEPDCDSTAQGISLWSPPREADYLDKYRCDGCNDAIAALLPDFITGETDRVEYEARVREVLAMNATERRTALAARGNEGN